MTPAREIGRAQLFDVDDDTEGSHVVKVEVERDGKALILTPAGCSVKGMANECAPVLLERNNGKLMLWVWADINQEDPTHIIEEHVAFGARRFTIYDVRGKTFIVSAMVNGNGSGWDVWIPVTERLENDAVLAALDEFIGPSAKEREECAHHGLTGQ